MEQDVAPQPEGGVASIFESEDAEGLMSAVALLKLLSNPHRLAIMCYLGGGAEMSVTKIGQRVGLSQSALSQHLAKLREHRIVKTRRDQQTIYYSLNSYQAEQVMALLREMYCSHVE